MFGNDISPKDRAAARLLGQAHREIVAAFMRRKKECGLKQQEIAARTGLDKSAVSRMLRGGGNPTLRTLAEISWAMGMEPELVLTPVEKKPGANTQPSAPTTVSTPKLEIIGGDWGESSTDDDAVQGAYP